MPNPEYEKLRSSFKPDRVKVLFVGESPPAGGTFFYAANSGLFRYTREAYGLVYGSRWLDGADFLHFFMRLGCYLDDISLDPVNHLDSRERRRALNDAVPQFARRTADYSPAAIVAVIASIKPFLNNAINLAGLRNRPLYILPHPSHGNQRKYVARLMQVLQELRQQSILL